jgi:hypothetical protein
MAETVNQCGLQRAVLQSGSSKCWQHIIGPSSQDTGLWSTGNGWAAYGMVRVLHTLQRWPASASTMSSQISSLKTWIQEILDCAMGSSMDAGLLRNYIGDSSWFGEISGTAILSAVAYRMATNDRSMFPEKYIKWADANRKTLAKLQSNGIFSPAVNPYNWHDTAKYTSGSPEGQAFAVFLATAYRDCVGAGVCSPPASSASTISVAGIGPFDYFTVLGTAVSFTPGATPTGAACGPPQSCDDNGCKGSFGGLAKYGTCTAGALTGCQCLPTPKTCGDMKSCDMNGCAGSFDGLSKYGTCKGNFLGEKRPAPFLLLASPPSGSVPKTGCSVANTVTPDEHRLQLYCDPQYLWRTPKLREERLCWLLFRSRRCAVSPVHWQLSRSGSSCAHLVSYRQY